MSESKKINVTPIRERLTAISEQISLQLSALSEGDEIEIDKLMEITRFLDSVERAGSDMDMSW
jgi:hypothetical protein